MTKKMRSGDKSEIMRIMRTGLRNDENHINARGLTQSLLESMNVRAERATKWCMRTMRQAQLTVQALLTWTSDRNKRKYRGQVC